MAARAPRSPGSLEHTLARFARTVVRDYSVEDALQELAGATVEILDVTSASVSLADEDGQLRLVTCAGDPLDVDVVDGLGEHDPIPAAYRSGEPLVVTDAAARPDAAASTPQGGRLLVVAALPMPLDDERIGVLALWDTEPGEVDADWLDTAQLLADLATTYVAASRRQQVSEQLTGQLRHALTHRVVVEQAKGLVAGRHGLTLDAALDALRRYARDRNLQLRQVARAVVRGELDPLG